MLRHETEACNSILVVGGGVIFIHHFIHKEHDQDFYFLRRRHNVNLVYILILIGEPEEAYIEGGAS